MVEISGNEQMEGLCKFNKRYVPTVLALYLGPGSQSPVSLLPVPPMALLLYLTSCTVFF